MRASPMGLTAIVMAVGVGDGAWRAYFGQPTIMGQRIVLRVLSDSRNKLHSPGYMRLQKPLGDICEESWNCDDGLVCRENFVGIKTCLFCTNDDQCIGREANYRCWNVSSIESECRHKALGDPFDESDLWLIIITFLTIMLSAPAGVGGGCILVPMYLAIGGFSPHYSSALSTATIFGGAVSNNYFNMQKRHPQRNRPLIDYDACTILVPVLLLGTIIGVFFNAISPGWLISVLLVFALIYTTWRTGLKAYETYKKESGPDHCSETSRLLGGAGAHTAPPHDHPAKPPPSSSSAAAPAHAEDPVEVKVSDDDGAAAAAEREELARAEAAANPWALAALCACWAVVATSAALKGGEGSAGVAPCGSPAYWALVLLPAPVVGALAWRLAAALCAAHERREACGYAYADGDLRWTRRNAALYPLYCASAGVCAGALGIAAGMVLGPLLLELGMPPLTAAASSGFMVLFISSSTAFQFLVMGQLQADYALALCAVGATAGAVGNAGVGYLVRRYRKTWFVVAILAAVFALSSALMALAGYARAAQEQAHGRSPYGQPLCPRTPLLLHGGAAGVVH